jgi:hypothetical protein
MYCQKCGYFEEYKSMKDGPSASCIYCGGPVQQQYHLVDLLITPEVTSLGQQAERNKKHYGRSWAEDKTIQHKLQTERAREAAREDLAGRLPTGASLVEKDAETPWYRKGSDGPDMSLTKMTPAQQAKYIMEGKKT